MSIKWEPASKDEIDARKPAAKKSILKGTTKKDSK